MYAQIVTSSLTVGMGGSAGLESPITITGAALGSNYAQDFRLNYKDRTLLLACGVAAGIATAFNAPVAGVLFAIEEQVFWDMFIFLFPPLFGEGYENIKLLAKNQAGELLDNSLFEHLNGNEWWI
ncbi:hypothetical protein FQR65_LT17924 [Abscondita terminalis]|nr:hypothetical protein FQR65_LT17924 [Abscondita terminalis]